MNWLPAITSTTLLATILWLARTWIFARLTKSIQHGYDQKLESLRSELREKEELLKGDLRNKEMEIAALRNASLSSATSRRAAVDKRRLEAIDQLWGAIENLASLRNAAQFMATVDFKKTAIETARNAQTRAGFEALAKTLNLDSIKSNNAHIARPFVSPTAWALFAAYNSILAVATVQILLLKKGIAKPEFANEDAVIKLVTAALPHQKPLIDKYGASAANLLVEELEEGILRELQAMLKGDQADKETVTQAAAILKLSNEVNVGIPEEMKAPAPNITRSVGAADLPN